MQTFQTETTLASTKLISPLLQMETAMFFFSIWLNFYLMP
jgi:hypothetical protein